MLYSLVQAQADTFAPMRLAAGMTAAWLDRASAGLPRSDALARIKAACQLIAHAGTTHVRPPFGIDSSPYGNGAVPVREQVLAETPFASLLRFVKEGAREQPKVLVVAPMSGHFSTLLRNTVRTLLPDNDVYITDWRNARDIPLSAGRFGVDECIEHLIGFMEALGPGSHVLAVCQPAPIALAAVALMAQSGSAAQPRTLTLMAGPVDTRVSPTQVNRLANDKPIEWFEKKLISTVPLGFPGGGRKVYPGFVQLSAFMAMNVERHSRAHYEYYENMVQGRDDKVRQHREFYDEYLAVMDLPAEFYLETVRKIFQEHELARGVLRFRGRKVEPAAIRRTALFAVEGEMDDICAIGQTMAALDLCVGLRPSMRRYHLQTGVGHYGVFSGRRWAQEIYPRVRTMIHAHSA